MRTRRKIKPETKQEIMQLVEQGQKVAELSQKYGIKRTNIYNWISLKKLKAKNNGKPKATPIVNTKVTLVGVDKQLDALTIKYQKDIKALLLKQIKQALHGV